MCHPQRRRRQGGFTLIEVLLVVAILVILAALVVPNISKMFSGSQENIAKAKISGLKTAIEAYHLHCNTYPSSLDALLSPPGDLPNPAKWQGPYVDNQQSLLDPWDKPYNYSPQSSHGAAFDIWTDTPDGKTICSWQ